MGGGGGPQETKWSQVVRLRDRSSEDFRRAMEALAMQYWKPVYRTIRWGWGRSNEDAKDFTQEFFSHLMASDVWGRIGPEKGRFRTFLKLMLKRFMQDQTKSDQRLKRGGGASVLSLDAIADADDRGGPASAEPAPEARFDREWARCAATEALAAVTEDADLLRRKYLSDPAPSYEALAQEAGLTVPQVQARLAKARKALRAALETRVREYVDSAADVEEECEYLLRVL